MNDILPKNYQQIFLCAALYHRAQKEKWEDLANEADIPQPVREARLKKVDEHAASLVEIYNALDAK